jgi:hypothetical protein
VGQVLIQPVSLTHVRLNSLLDFVLMVTDCAKVFSGLVQALRSILEQAIRIAIASRAVRVLKLVQMFLAVPHVFLRALLGLSKNCVDLLKILLDATEPFASTPTKRKQCRF